MPFQGKSGLWAATAALTLAATAPAGLAQAPPAAAAADAAEAQEAGHKAFMAGAAAYQRRDYTRALEFYAAALGHFAKAWPDAKDADRARAVQLQLHRARAHAQAGLASVDGFLADAGAAWRLIGALGGEGGEEQALQNALFECLTACEALPDKLRLLAGYRKLLESNLPSNQTGDQGLTRRIKMQIGQTIHDTAFAQDRAGKLEAAAATLKLALDYRAGINDLNGAAWSAQNLFWNLLRRNEHAAAAEQFTLTVQILRKAPDVDIEGSLVHNLESWIQARAAKKQTTAAAALLAAIRTGGALQQGGLTTFTLGRASALELALTTPGDAASRATRLACAEGLITAGTQELQPAWSWLGHSTRARTALEMDAEARSAAGLDPTADAAAALAAARRLQDPHREGMAKLLVADVLAATGEHDAAEQQILEVMAAASQPGAEPWLRELARRTGAALAAASGKDKWRERYQLHATPKQPGHVGGHTIMGRDRQALYRDMAAMPGEGAVLTITRRGTHLVIRSPLYKGSLAVEWSWRMRYVNANGILLAVQGPAVAVVGKHDELSAPKASNGLVRPAADGGLDLALLAGDRLPPLASQTAIPDGESAFVNKYLRVFR